MRELSRALAVLAAFLVSEFMPTLVEAVSFTPLGDLPGGRFFSTAFDISADGSVVVGWAESSAQATEAFRWTAEDGMVGLGDLPGGGLDSIAWGVSADGSVVVGAGTPDLGMPSCQAFRWTAEDGMVGLPVGEFTTANAVSADGYVVVGENQGFREGFRWTAEDGMIALGFDATDVSGDGSVVVGPGFRWTAEDGMVPLGFHANAVSGDGSVVVGLLGRRAVRWTAEDGIVDIGDFAPEGISADGSVVVGAGTRFQGLGAEAFVWDTEIGLRAIQDILRDSGLDLPGWTLRRAMAVADDGRTIAGFGTNPSGDAEAWVAVIPEPSTAALVSLGLLGLAARRRVVERA